MKEKDKRVKLMSEILNGIKVLKLYAWEESFNRIISDVRAKELSLLKKAGYVQAFSSFFWQCAPFFVSHMVSNNIQALGSASLIFTLTFTELYCKDMYVT